MKFLRLTLATAVTVWLMGCAAPQRYYEGKDFQHQLAVAITNHDRSYCFGSTQKAVADLEALIAIFEAKLRHGVSAADKKLLHGEVIPWYGRLAKVHRKSGADDLSDRATQKAIANWRLSDMQRRASTPDELYKLVDDLDAEHPCKR